MLTFKLRDVSSCLVCIYVEKDYICTEKNRTFILLINVPKETIKMANAINDRIDVRLSKEQKELIKFACSLSGFKNLSEFILFCVNKEANKIIIENNQILQSMEDKKVFLDALLNPPQPNKQLQKAQQSYLTFLESNEA